MISGADSSTQSRNSSRDSIKIGFGQVEEMEAQENDLSASKVTHQYKNAQTKLVIEPIFKQVKKLCTLLAEENELGTSGNS